MRNSSKDTGRVVERLLFGSLIGMTWACGTSSNGTASGGDGYRFVDDFATMLCDLAAQCCAPNGFAAPSDCVTQAKLQLHREIDGELDAGQRFDPQAGERCMAAYRALAPSCPASWTSAQSSACGAVFVGNQPPGTKCSGGCAPSDLGSVTCLSYTSRGPDGGITESGELCQVVVTVGPGEACDDYGRMAVERHCDFAKNSTCIRGICSTPQPIGATCTNSGYDCVPEAVCSAGRCVARVPIGGACTSSECVSSATCQSGRCEVASRWKKMCSGDFD